MSLPTLHWNPWWAYECMITAFSEKRYWSAHALSTQLLSKLHKPGSGAERWFKVKKWIIVQEIADQSRTHLTPEEIDQCRQNNTPSS